MSDRPFISHFSPQRTDPELLEQIHVQRHDLLAESVARVRESVLSEDKHHLLFIGPRGAGKTHLVRLIHHRLSQEAKMQPDLAERLRFAWLNEDETATSFLKLLILIYRDVTQRYPQEFPAADLQSIYGQSADLARERLGESLLRHLGTRTLVVLMENLDSLFKHMPEAEQRIWRAFVQNHPVFTTVGTAQSLFDGVSSRNQPFFGFFDTQHLTPLNVEGAVQLLTKIASINGDTDLADYLQTPTGHARVQAIHDLAGGNPRIYLIFSEFLTKESLDDLVRPFEETADRQLTSYYQERLRWLSAQQQEIIQFLCHQRQPVPVKSIAEGVFSSHNSITGQLKLLRDWRYLTSKQRGREVFYELAEPLMRLALQVKETHDGKPLALIVDFLRVWYDREDLEERLKQSQAGGTTHAYLSAALTLLKSNVPNLRHQLIRNSLKGISLEAYSDSDFAKLKALAAESGLAEDWATLGSAFEARKDFRQAINAYDQAVQSCKDRKQLGSVLVHRGSLKMEMRQLTDAIADFTQIIEMGESDDKFRSVSLLFRGLAYNDVRDFNRAKIDFEEAISLNSKKTDICAAARFGLAMIKEGQGGHDLAFEAYSEILVTSKIGPFKAIAFIGRAQAHEKKKDYDLAESDYTAAIKLKNLGPQLASDLHYRRALLRHRSERYNEAISDFNRVITFKVSSTIQLGMCYLMRAVAHHMTKKPDLAYADLDELINISNFHLIRDLPNHSILSTLIIWSIFFRSSDTDQWIPDAEKFISIATANSFLPELGEALVHHLNSLKESRANHEVQDLWFEAWRTAYLTLPPEDQSKMEIPLRLLKSGIAFLKTKDEGSFLVLPLEERRILRKSLKLPPERSE